MIPATAGFFLSIIDNWFLISDMSVQLTLYARNDCHLCEDMKQALSDMEMELDFVTEVILIENNDELERAYGTKIPVLMIKEEIICESFLDRIALEEKISRVRARHVNEKHS